MPSLTMERVALLAAEARAVYCPNCSLTPGRVNNATGWNRERPWERECFNCGNKWVNEQLRTLLVK